jgi:hypothetical protein
MSPGDKEREWQRKVKRAYEKSYVNRREEF